MDDQKPQDQKDQSEPVSVPINEIAPPPAEESVGQKINVMSGEDNEQTETSDTPVVVAETTPEPVDEPDDEVAQSDERLSPVTAPPEEEKIEDGGEQTQPVEAPKQADDLFKQDEPSPVLSAPAEMGVAASQMNGQKHPHRNNKKLATIVTIVTALILAGTAVFVYLSANKNTDADNNSETTQTNGSNNESQQEVVQPAKVEDIDQTIAEVEESLLTLDDEADFSEESLSNDTLGL